jgi:hypothetical protein
MACILLGDRMLWILLMKKYNARKYSRLFPPPEGKPGLHGFLSLIRTDVFRLRGRISANVEKFIKTKTE